MTKFSINLPLVFGNWQNFETSWAIVLANMQILICCKRPNIEQRIANWSHYKVIKWQKICNWLNPVVTNEAMKRALITKQNY